MKLKTAAWWIGDTSSVCTVYTEKTFWNICVKTGDN